MPKRQPEAIIQEEIINLLTVKGWYVRNTHGNIYQMGLPDLYACHKRYGTRWVEVKCPTGYKFTPAQMDVFPRFTAEGVGIWILTGATEHQYKKLFQPANWWTFLK